MPTNLSFTPGNLTQVAVTGYVAVREFSVDPVGDAAREAHTKLKAELGSLYEELQTPTAATTLVINDVTHQVVVAGEQLAYHLVASCKVIREYYGE
jgi:hypothetical protein